MTTFKEFKDLGVVFVAGDVIMSHLLSKEDAEYLNDTYKYDIDGTTSSFAWRPLNTLPDNPKFKYEIGGHMPQWRPLLDQSALKPVNDAAVKPNDDKPVFTQAMADRGEQVKVGMLFSTAAGNQEALMVSDKSVVFEVDGYLYTEIHEFIHPIDTRTPKQKAVEEMFHVAYPDKEPSGLLSRALEKLYDAGYLKC